MTGVDTVLDIYRDIDAIHSAIGLMGWDRQVLMPPGGSKARGIHTERLTNLSHALLTSERLKDAVESAKSQISEDSDELAMLHRLDREIGIESKLPASLVSRKAKVSSDSYEVWKRARAENDFPAMKPYLTELFEIAKETAGFLGYVDHPYDALIDLYEEGATTEDAREMFRSIGPVITDLVSRISQREPTDDSSLYGDWDKSRLIQFAKETASQIGYRFENGRLDIAPNAFCAGFSYRDVRLTTRASDHIKGIVSSSLHEMGHGLYEQGSNPDWDRTPLAGGISLAVHESQSRFWENIIGRSKPFWNFFLPQLKAKLPELDDLSLDQFYAGMNRVQPEPIRVGADELTYNRHIQIRFELEVAIVEGSLDVADLPEAWNEKTRAYLGFIPESDSVGCLQDVHWSKGSVGYFATYSMGNLIGAQIWEKLRTAVGDTDSFIAAGHFEPILGWLQQNLYRKSKRYTPKELISGITGSTMKPDAWIRYATDKYSSLYRI